MRLPIVGSILAFGVLEVIAQDCFYCNQSAPFKLVIRWTKGEDSDSALFSCHEGAAIDGICVTTAFDPPIDASTYYFNYSSSNETPDPKIGYAGLLTWNMEVEIDNRISNLSFPMILTYDAISNVGVPMFIGDDFEYGIGFDQHNLMYLLGYTDDSLSPIQDKVKPYYSWYVCTTMWELYVYQTLSWVIGRGKPENPSCVKVDVERVFI